MQFVRDEDDGAPVRSQIADHGKEAVALLRRQHRRRFVEDQDPCVAIERLQDLHPLPHADREPPDDRAGIDLEMIARRELADFRYRRRTIEEAGALRLAAVDHVLPDRQRIEELEGLMNHAHAFSDGVEGGAEADLPAPQQDPSLVGRLHPVEDRHQCRFSGAVFAHDRVHFAALDREADMVVGDKRAVTLDDADGF